MTVTHVGSTKKYSSSWENIFQGKSGKTKATAENATAKTSNKAAKKTAKPAAKKAKPAKGKKR